MLGCVVNQADQAHTASHRRSPRTVNNLAQISLAQRLRVGRERLAGCHKVLHQQGRICNHDGACLLGGVAVTYGVAKLAQVETFPEALSLPDLRLTVQGGKLHVHLPSGVPE